VAASRDTVDLLMCAALRGEQPAWPWGDDPEATRQVLDHANFHGVVPLLHAQGLSGWPPGLVAAVRDQSVQRAMWELGHQHLLVQLLARFHEGGVQPVIFKGTALAYSLYPNPVLRTRGDTDLIIPARAKDFADEALRDLGWKKGLGVGGEHASYQCSYTRHGSDGATHALDLHWKINNSQVLARLFTYEELLQTAQPLPALGPHAKAASPVLAMLIACMHRATHRTNPYYVDGKAHSTDDRRVWLADIHLLSQKFGAADWREFLELARVKGLRACAAEGLLNAHRCFGGPTAPIVAQLLSPPLPREAAAAYLAAGKTKQQWLDFQALESLADRTRLLAEVAFPSADYMRARFGASSGSLSLLYMRRALGGATKFIRNAMAR
jgi:hypothetical protein